ncbi:MAG: serine/threonine-protein kinase [Myxococcota bacterium]
MASEVSAPGAVVIAGRYQLGKLLGEGRTGQVYRARDLKTGDRLAVKLLHKPLCTVPEQVRRFAREFEVTRSIDHPNVIRGVAFGQVDDGPYEGTSYLALELLEGKRLSDLLRTGGMTSARAARIALDVARALAAAHQLGLIHRDIEPGNVIVVRAKGKELAKVLDFGLARLQSNDEALTDFGIRLGTAEYMSPEYVETGELEPRSDVYALGALLYAMLTGTPPFVGRTLSVMQEHVASAPPSPSTRVPGLPTWLEALVMEMLAKAPEQRPSSDEVVQRLDAGIPELDAEASDERRAHATFNPGVAPPPMAIQHHSEAAVPVYPDPKPLPGVPIAVFLIVTACGMAGFAGFVLLLLILVFV